MWKCLSVCLALDLISCVWRVFPVLDLCQLPAPVPGDHASSSIMNSPCVTVSPDKSFLPEVAIGHAILSLKQKISNSHGIQRLNSPGLHSKCLYPLSPLTSFLLCIWNRVLLYSPDWPGSHHADQFDLESVLILLPLPSECWDYRHAPLYLTRVSYFCFVNKKNSASCPYINTHLDLWFSCLSLPNFDIEDVNHCSWLVIVSRCFFYLFFVLRGFLLLFIYFISTFVWEVTLHCLLIPSFPSMIKGMRIRSEAGTPSVWTTFIFLG